MRDWTVPFPGEIGWLLLGPNSSHRDHRQAAETYQRRLCQLHHKVGLGLSCFRLIDKIVFFFSNALLLKDS